MKKPFGNTGGLKASQIRKLENLHRRRVPPQFLITAELTRDIALLSHDIGRQIGLLIDRAGKITAVIVGDHQKIVIPETRDHRVTTGRLRGLRCVHTHLKDEPLSRDDLTDLSLLRLDLMAVVSLKPDGLPNRVYVGHILPGAVDGPPHRLLPPLVHHELDIGCLELIQSLEAELAQVRALARTHPGVERALLVSVSDASRAEAEESLAELTDLAVSGGVDVLETILQQRGRPDPRFLMGRGKLEELTIMALQKGASMIIFDQELNASQIRSIAELVEMKVIDRTQLILDIFAQRAQTREGKLQVELAQMKYLLPRLATKNTAMSRLTGGIGGRGPGETKLEINRRRVREQINRLSKSLDKVKRRRKQQRARRQKRALPVISIIGYTNAGKSTLLNTLTKSNVRAENRLFATLDPSSRRLRIPRDREVIITDTVGFIRNLPKDLFVAFRATLEELRGADLLLHVIDIGNPRHVQQIESVERILADLDLGEIPMIRVLNKQDLVEKAVVAAQCRSLGGIGISAREASTLGGLVKRIAARIDRAGRAR